MHVTLWGRHLSLLEFVFGKCQVESVVCHQSCQAAAEIVALASSLLVCFICHTKYEKGAEQMEDRNKNISAIKHQLFLLQWGLQY